MRPASPQPPPASEDACSERGKKGPAPRGQIFGCRGHTPRPPVVTDENGRELIPLTAAEAIAAMDLRPVIPAITAPTLVIAATEDPSTPPWHGARIARAVPGARLRVLRGTSHLVSYQTPGQVTVELSNHLAPLL
jgi:pimeloyl-ACP methyl ester carboxylesterase